MVSPVTSNNTSIWVAKSNSSGNTSLACGTCGAVNYVTYVEWAGADTTNPTDKIISCYVFISDECVQSNGVIQTNGVLSLHNSFASEGVMAMFECQGSATSFTNTGWTATNTAFPNGNGFANGVLTSATSITSTVNSGCGGTPSGYIIGVKAASATTPTCTWDIGTFDYGAQVTSGNATVTAKVTSVGNLIAVNAWCLTTCTVTGVTVGSQSATQTTVNGSTTSAAGQPFLYYVLSANTAGSQTITMTISGAYTDAQVMYAEFVPSQGCTASHDVDSANASSATGATITTPTITPTHTGELLWNFTPVESHGNSVLTPWGCNIFALSGETLTCFMGTTINPWGYVLSSGTPPIANNVTQISSDPWQSLITSFALAPPSAGGVRNQFPRIY